MLIVASDQRSLSAASNSSIDSSPGHLPQISFSQPGFEIFQGKCRVLMSARIFQSRQNSPRVLGHFALFDTVFQVHEIRSSAISKKLGQGLSIDISLSRCGAAARLNPNIGRIPFSPFLLEFLARSASTARIGLSMKK
jgi:hypothetical protein